MTVLRTMENDTALEVSHKRLDFLSVWLQAVAMVTLTCVTICGNCVVIVAFGSNKTLRKLSSFIPSLATADLLVGCTLPIRMLETIYQCWPWSLSSCHVMLVIDNTLCTTSTFNILLITIDRWWCVHKPFHHRVRQTRAMVTIAIALSWILGFLSYLPPLYIWQITTGSNDVTNMASPYCQVAYSTDLTMAVLMASGTYLLPLLLLIYCNMSIYLKVRNRKDKKIRRSVSTSEQYCLVSRKSSNDTESEDNEELGMTLVRPRSRTCSETREPSPVRYNPGLGKPRRPSVTSQLPEPMDIYRLQGRRPSGRRVSFDSGLYFGTDPFRGPQRYNKRGSTSDELVAQLLRKQDKKAARLLAFLVCAFSFCWTPCVVLSLLNAWYGGRHATITFLYHVSKWLLLGNSAINPFLYANGNSKFRQVIRSWLGMETGKHSPTLYELSSTFPKGLQFMRQSKNGLSISNELTAPEISCN